MMRCPPCLHVDMPRTFDAAVGKLVVAPTTLVTLGYAAS
jgi:hypothetical protein